jgi:type IV pilus assembly protein PilY1
MDGEAVSLVYETVNDGNITPSEGDYVWAFIGQRRGGPGLYAFNLTDPDNPVLKWKITNQTPGFEQLALTFSTPQAVRMDLGDALGTDDGDANTPVLIFAGGYNGGWDGNSRVGKDAGDGNDTVGNSIYIVNADTGDLIWKAVGPDADTDVACTDSDTNFCVDGSADANYGSSGRPSMVDSIPSTMAVVDSDNNNVIDRAYVGDSGGNVWRIELTEDEYKASGTDLRDDDNWYVTKLGAFGGSSSDDRRFFHAPDYVKALESDTKNAYDGVVITSGNRADPRETTVQNYAFMMKDTFTTTNGNPAIKTRPPFNVQNPGDSNPTGLTDITDLCVNGSTTEEVCSAADLTNGWKLQLEATGEKGLSSPLIASGVVLFTTYLPNDGTADSICAPSEGSGLVYLVSLADGSAEFDLAAEVNVWTKEDRFSNVGAGIPGDVIPYEDQVLIPGKGIGGRQIYDIPGENLWRIHWREEGVDK